MLSNHMRCWLHLIDRTQSNAKVDTLCMQIYRYLAHSLNSFQANDRLYGQWNFLMHISRRTTPRRMMHMLTLIIALVVIRTRVALSLIAFILEVISPGDCRWSSSANDLCNCVPWFTIRLLQVVRSSIFVLSIFIVFSISVGSNDFSTKASSLSSSSSSTATQQKQTHRELCSNSAGYC